ncbi:hypothetical protein DFA_07103 [Cavenderia fasciculata]|uniref:Uncharacterized protein n=1 Tax=Cavenderia fasciculata TaxID=261658 RepID=F4PVH4_CACFS|nr:uncharacterized protein DFA_07103 [Cavenderia fasciculata]EGG19988.1 hypothetical protein DFA_07103 [Cavenderia fasciculata]|eukprot:XP_004366971.1 hypothetical protein DFA_07103 [Cavenderia fasciculata]
MKRSKYIYLFLIILSITILNTFGYTPDELITNDSGDSNDTTTIDNNGTISNSTSGNVTRFNTSGSAIQSSNNELKFNFPIVGIATNNPNSTAPIIISKYQAFANTDRIVKKDYQVLGGESNVMNSIEVTHTASYNGCVALLSKTDSGCLVMTYSLNGSNGEPENSIQNTRELPGINCTNIAIDDTYIWLPTTENRLEVLIHRNCQRIEPTNLTKPLGKKIDFNGTDTTIIFADPRTKPKRSLYIFQQKTSVLTQYTYNNSLEALTVTSTTNIGEACSVSTIKNGQIMASYHDGFKAFNISNDQSIPFDSTNIDKVDLCGPFVYNNGSIYSITNNNSFIQILPGIVSRVSYPCYNSSNGIIEVKGAINHYNIKWLDNGSTKYRREGLQAKKYSAVLTSTIFNDPTSIKLTFNLIEQKNPGHPLKHGVCRTDSNGTVDFKNIMTPGLKYSFVLYDQNKNFTSKNGTFNYLRSKNYTIDMTSIDEYGFKCSNRINIPITQGAIFDPEIKIKNPSCFNSTDGEVEIVDFYPDLYNYEMVPHSIQTFNKFIKLGVDNLYEYVLFITEKNDTSCKLPKKINLKSPPQMKPPLYTYSRVKECYGEPAILKVQYIPGMDYSLIKKENGQRYQSTRTDGGYSFFTNIPIGNFTLHCSVPKTNGTSLCKNELTLPIRIIQKTQIELDQSRVTTQCNPDGKENLIVKAKGGQPERNGDYYYIGKYANAKGPYLNVSYWVDGVYSVTVADANGCAVTYDNFTVSRPSECSIYYDHNGNVVHKAGIAPVINSHLALALGIGLGVGIPVLVAALIGGVVLYRHIGKAKSRALPPPNSIPVFMGGKIQNIDNY